MLYDPIDRVARSKEILRDLSAPSFAMLVSNRIACFTLIGRDKARAISQTNRVQLSEYHFKGCKRTRRRQHDFQSKFKDKRYDYNTVRSHLLDSANSMLDHIYNSMTGRKITQELKNGIQTRHLDVNHRMRTRVPPSSNCETQPPQEEVCPCVKK